MLAHMYRGPYTDPSAAHEYAIRLRGATGVRIVKEPSGWWVYYYRHA